MVELVVADWELATAWYRDVFGLRVVMADEPNSFVLLDAGAGHVALKAGVPCPGSVHLVFEVADLTAELTRLAGHGVSPESPVKVSAEGYRRAFIRDRDGYRIGLFDRIQGATT